MMSIRSLADFNRSLRAVNGVVPPPSSPVALLLPAGLCQFVERLSGNLLNVFWCYLPTARGNRPVAQSVAGNGPHILQKGACPGETMIKKRS